MQKLTTALCECFCEECTSIATFRGVRTILEQCKPEIAILENVDSMDTQDDDKQSPEPKYNNQLTNYSKPTNKLQYLTSN